jgi:flavin-binding protein dodecin
MIWIEVSRSISLVEWSEEIVTKAVTEAIMRWNLRKLNLVDVVEKTGRSCAVKVVR